MLFALAALLAVLGIFVLDGGLAGVASLAAMLLVVAACVRLLRREDAATRAQSDRTGLAGWFGGYF